MADMNGLIRNPLILGGAAVLVIAAAVGGYFLGTSHSTAPQATATAAAGTTASAAPVATDVCGATLALVQAYGITTSASTLVSNDATKTGTGNSVNCSVKDGATTYTVTVEQVCSDMTKSACLQIDKVADSTGATDFQRTQFLEPTP